jgi:hypothetical protein
LSGRLRNHVARGVYAIVNTVTQECFVGSSSDIRVGWAVHRSTLREGSSKYRLLQAAWTRYGEQAFRFVVLEEVADVTTLRARERHFMDLYNATTLGYNTPPSEPHAPAHPAVCEIVNVIVPDELIARLRTLTEQRGATIAGFVRQAIAEKLEREST